MEARHCLALVLGTCIWSPVIAATDTDSLVREMRRLSQRVEQLEAANRRLEAAQNQSVTAPGSDTTERLEDVEQEVRKMSQPGKLEQALEGVSAEASLTMVGQRALQGTVSGKDESQLNYRADVEVSLPGGRIGDAEGKIFAQFRMGQGNGLADLNPTLTGSINSTAFQLTNGDDTAAILAQAWYQLDIPVGGARTGELGQAEITLGKIDPFLLFDQNALADDESEAFLNSVFVHNPLLDSGGDAGVDDYGFTPGLRMAYFSDRNSPNLWGLSLGIFGSGSGASFDTSFTRPFLIAQAEYGGKIWASREGAYRLYSWTNGRATPFANEFDTTEERHSGWGLSTDQEIARDLGLFLRYGYSTQGQVKFDRALTLGGQLKGGGWGREHDHLGLAFGWLAPSGEFKQQAPTLDADGDGQADFGLNPSRTERQIELFYAWQLNTHLQLSPSLQWIGHPGGDGTVEDILALGLRARASF